MKLEDLKKLKKGTPVVSHTKNSWIEGTFEGLIETTSFGRFTNFYDAVNAIASGKGRKKTEVKIKTAEGMFEYVSPRSVGVITWKGEV